MNLRTVLKIPEELASEEVYGVGIGTFIEEKENYFSTHKSNFSLEEIGKFINLRELEIWSDEIPTSLFNLKKLERLAIGSKVVSENIGKLQTLIDLELGYVETVSAEIGKLVNLKYLYLWGFEESSFQEIPKEIGKLKNLKVLNLDGSFKEFPKEIGNLKELEELEISGKFEKVPAGISKLSKLRKLEIAEIEEFPREIGNLKNLEELRISGNFEKVPTEIEKLSKLRKLDISGNLGEFPKEIGNLKELEELEISGNFETVLGVQNILKLGVHLKREITEITISGFENLRELVVGDEVEFVKLYNLPNLKQLYLESDFEISKDSSKNLETLYLRYFEKELNLSHFPNLQELDLDTPTISKIFGKTVLKSLKIQHGGSITLPEIDSLEELYLYDTKVEFEFPKRLKILSLCRNIDEFPHFDLEELYLEGLFSKELPDWIENQKKLRVLDIQWSSLEKVSEAITDFENLEKLNLFKNHIEFFPKGIGKLKNLKEFFFEEEKISFNEYNRIRKALPNTEIPDKEIEVFVYGTLKKGFYYQILKDAQFLGKATTEESYPMISENGTFPYLIDKEGCGKKIAGELYRIDKDILKELDFVEGYPKYYYRKDIKVRVHDEPKAYWRYAITYFKIDYFRI
jgi:Leucine-rich repeat (LRR) protein/gamma-glutamylcyclotransferase (GGCT)/AIG2-like uncharacterized protein YtfP